MTNTDTADAKATAQQVAELARADAAGPKRFASFWRLYLAGNPLNDESKTAHLASLKEKGVPFMTAPPATYYEMLAERLPGHGEPVDELQARGILLDGSTEEGDPRLLLQIFSETMIGPVFFEFIQRKKDEGFGEGNFKALFESMERDQIRRGVDII